MSQHTLNYEMNEKIIILELALLAWAKEVNGLLMWHPGTSLLSINNLFYGSGNSLNVYWIYRGANHSCVHDHV